MTDPNTILRIGLEALATKWHGQQKGWLSGQPNYSKAQVYSECEAELRSVLASTVDPSPTPTVQDEFEEEMDRAFQRHIVVRRFKTPRDTPLPDHWQRIETAPKDGRMLLLYPSSCWTDDTECDYEVSYWDDCVQAFNQMADPDDFTGFTHWLPLPGPPTRHESQEHKESSHG